MKAITTTLEYYSERQNRRVGYTASLVSTQGKPTCSCTFCSKQTPSLDWEELRTYSSNILNHR